MELCPPAIIYLLFSIIQVVLDTSKGLYNTALVKIFVMVVVTILLNILCQQGLGVVSWIIVFIPFMLMTVIVSIILYIFGLNAATGNLSNISNSTANVRTDTNGDIIVYDPDYNPKTNPVYYASPNLIIPNPKTHTI